MLEQIFTVVERSRGTILQDLIGVIALTVLLVGSLSLPSFF